MNVPGKHLLDYWYVLVRRRWAVYLALTVVTVVALIGSSLVTPMYRATATLQIERQNPEIFTFQDLARVDHSWAAYTDFYQTQYRILASDAVATEAVQRLDLVSHPRFQSGRSPAGPRSWMRSLLPARKAKVTPNPVRQAAQRLQAGLEVTPIRNSHLVQVSWISEDPRLAAKVANEVAAAYIRFTMSSVSRTSSEASDFLAEQVTKLRRDIQRLEGRLQDYGESKRILSIDDSQNITIQALSDISRQRTEARTRLAKARATYDALRSAPPESIPEVLHSELIARLKQERAAHEAEYSEKSRRFKEDWPEMQTLRGRMEQVQARLDLEIAEIARRVLMAAEAEYRKAEREHQNLDGLLRQQETAAQGLKRDAVAYAEYQSEVAKKREMLSALLARQNEMALSTSLTETNAASSNVRVVDGATPPAGPFRPNLRLNLLLALALGLALGVGAAFFLEYMDNTVTSPAEVERVASLPVLAVVPHHGATVVRARRRAGGPEGAVTSVDLIPHHDPKARISEAYRELRTAILLSVAGEPPRRIMFTSALPEEGKSSTAVNLAVVLAQLGRRIALVDVDLRRPRLQRVFGLQSSAGASSFLAGQVSDLRSVVLPTGIPRVDLLPSGPIPPNPSELLNSASFTSIGTLLLEAGYDHVIVDSPPALAVPDPLIIAGSMDAVVLVVRAGRTPHDSLRAAVEKFRSVGAKPTGVVLNDLPVDTRHYGGYEYYGTATQAAPQTGEEARASREATPA